MAPVAVEEAVKVSLVLLQVRIVGAEILAEGVVMF